MPTSPTGMPRFKSCLRLLIRPSYCCILLEAAGQGSSGWDPVTTMRAQIDFQAEDCGSDLHVSWAPGWNALAYCPLKTTNKRNGKMVHLPDFAYCQAIALGCWLWMFTFITWLEVIFLFHCRQLLFGFIALEGSSALMEQEAWPGAEREGTHRNGSKDKDSITNLCRNKQWLGPLLRLISLHIEEASTPFCHAHQSSLQTANYWAFVFLILHTLAIHQCNNKVRHPRAKGDCQSSRHLC